MYISLRITITDRNGIPVFLATVLEVRHERLIDIVPQELDYEHDPACRSTSGLFDTLQKLYPNLYEQEIALMGEEKINEKN